MQFFHLFSFVVVASYAAALPQPAGRSEKHSNSADATLVSGLEARSYQPGSNSQKDSATLVSLKRRGGSGSRQPPSPATTPKRIVREIDTPLDKAELGTLLLSSKIEEVENNHADVPENVKAAGKTIGGITENLLLAYFQKALYVTKSLKDWVENTGEDIVAVIKSGLGDAEYSKVESSLKEADEKLTDRANGYLRLVNTALSTYRKKCQHCEKQMETIHVSFMYLFESYTEYFEKLGLQLKKFDAGKNIRKSLSGADASLVDFTRDQRDLYEDIISGL
ncbi:hypothetical protein BASA50_003813 [Batrachochytrium salamandrivorans]|uniref:Uncharacterized protein n=1 Tax=Batrachochytrium salamandrivorans TaxID=1357716 RepID=A0ABQ8FHI1_9FUNG|nr:hypothetical protein BASA50_003813 [Batrachochytrium salamandrivorans]